MWMYTLLPRILNMSLTAGIVTLFVLPVRLILKKAPRIFSYLLWAAVLFRLLCPVSFSGNLSLLSLVDAPVTEKNSIEYIPDFNQYDNTISTSVPVYEVGEQESREAPNGWQQRAEEAENVLIVAAAWLWMFGMAAMLLYGGVSLFLLKGKLVGRIHFRDNIYLCDYISSPFVLGCLRPQIYLPSTLTKKEQDYIILHEQTHIRRGDHIIKTAAYFALMVHWFNPLIWLAFILAEKDMEMSCDEAVLRKMGSDIKADYSSSLLNLSAGHKALVGIPLAFGEGNIKSRIKNVIHYKKPAPWIILLCVLLVAGIAFGLIANPKEKQKIPYIDDAEINWNGISEILLYADGYYGRTFEDVLVISDEEIVNDLAESALNSAEYELIKEEDYKEGENGLYIDFENGVIIGMYEDINYGSISSQMQVIGEPYYRLPEDLWQKAKSLLNENRPEAKEIEEREEAGEVKEPEGTVQKLPAEYSAAVWFKPEDIHDLISASLLVNGDIYLATDKEDLAFLEQELGTIEAEIKGGSKCPFSSILFLTRSDGVCGQIMLAEDSCAVYRSEDVYYDFGAEDNAAIYDIWGLTPEALRVDKSSYSAMEDEKAWENFPFLERWAEAFCNRDGKTIMFLSSQEMKASFEEQGMTAAGTNDFGWSSPWPWNYETDCIVSVPRPANAEILYYAWTSEPHVTVWKEYLTFHKTDDEWLVETEKLKTFEYICTAEEFYEAYPDGIINNTQMDYLYNGAGEVLNDNARENRKSDYYSLLFEPGTAARCLLNILNNENKAEITVKEKEEGEVQVIFHFVDNSYAYVNMIQPYGEDGIWIPRTWEK